ncbi:MAG: hypothetical protein HKL86_01270 [Acidimicrobiaceae bacterium]|nr:hypothetical protein [Acidimicrobiaceae bacterium]
MFKVVDRLMHTVLRIHDVVDDASSRCVGIESMWFPTLKIVLGALRQP